MSKDHLEHIDFDFIRYANCWEDVEILLEAFNLKSESIVISIASGGDNCLSLAAESPEKVIAVDVSKPQLYLTELKLEAIRIFERIEYLEFAGFRDSLNRKNEYQKIRENLSKEAKLYWDERLDEIEEGIIHIGKFERYFQLFKPKFLHSIHDQQTIDNLFAVKTEEEQLRFYNKQWYHSDWKAMHSKFFSSDMLGKKGRDPEFMKQIEGSVSDLILEREVAHLKSKLCQSNQFLFYILNNSFDETHLPHYVRSENYYRVKANLDKIVIENGLLQEVASRHTSITHFNLSNIFEYMDIDQFEKAGEAILNQTEKGAQLAYWNFMIPRNLMNAHPNKVSFNSEYCQNLSKRDYGYFYKSFVLNEKK